jgi:hypothetical protein
MLMPAILPFSIMLMVKGGAEIVHPGGRRESLPRFPLRGSLTDPILVEYAPDIIANKKGKRIASLLFSDSDLARLT